MKDVYKENYKTLIKEAEGIKNGKISSAHGFEQITVSKCSSYQKQFRDSMQLQ